MMVLLPILLAAGTLVPDYFAIQNSFHDGTITGSEYAAQLAAAVARPEEVPASLRTERVGRGICLTTLVRDALEASRGDAAHNNLARLFFRPPTQASFVSPDGFFTIHYDTTGAQAVYQPTTDVNPADGVPDYVNRCAEFFDLSWRVEVDTLGFDSPPSDLGLGGSDNYDVYLHHYDAYGVTFPEGPSSQNPGRNDYYSHIFVDPTYSGFGYSDRLLPLKVTAAHEFQHACQFAYDVNENSAWMEHCATWMEDVVFDDVNDYVNYLPDFLSLPHKPLYWFNELYPYGACVWAHFLDQKYGRSVIEAVWEESIPNNLNAIGAVDNVLRSLGSSRDEAVAEFRIWNYFTGGRDDGAHYEEGSTWPLVPLMADHTELPVLDGAPVSEEAPASLACNYVRFTNLAALDSLRIHFAGQSGLAWAAGLIVPGAGSGAPEIGDIGLSGGQGTAVVTLGEAGSVILIPTCVSLASGTYTYWARDAYELFALSVVTVADDLGDGDSRVEAGESVHLGVAVTSIAAEWNDVVLSLATSDPAVNVIDGTAHLGPVVPGQTAESNPDSLLIEIAPSIENHRALFELSIGPTGDTPAMVLTFELMLGTPLLLIVDDDGGASLEQYLLATLDSLESLADVWDDQTGQFPDYPAATLDFAAYDAILWLTGDPGNALSEADIARVQNILEGGGHLLLSGQDIAESLSTSASGQALLADWIGVAYDGRENLHGILGVEADPVFGGLRFATSGYGFDGANNQASQDRLLVTGEATVSLTYQSGYPAAVRREADDSRLLFVGFGVEAVVDDNPSVNTRREFIAASLDYLVNGITGADGAPHATELRITGVWPNPTPGEIRAGVVATGMPAPLRVVLLDLAGRRVTELLHTTGSVLPPVLSLRIPDGTPNGAYLLRFDIDGSRRTLPVTLVR